MEYPEKVEYETDEIIESIKLIKFVLFSMRKIGDYSVDCEDFDIQEELFNFIVKSKVLNKLSKARTILESEFDNFPRKGDKGFLEIMTDDIKYWKPPK